MEHRITVKVSELGHDDSSAEPLLDVFLETHPESGAVVSQNLAEGSLSVTFTVDAHDAPDAAHRGEAIFSSGFDASGLARTRVVGLEVTAVTEPAATDAPIPA